MQEWIRIPGKGVCRYCETGNCDRMNIWDWLVLMYSDLHSYRQVMNKPKRCTVYQSMTRLVHGNRGYKNRVLVCDCVAKDIGDFFPNEDDASSVGFIDTYDDELNSDTGINILE